VPDALLSGGQFPSAKECAERLAATSTAVRSEKGLDFPTGVGFRTGLSVCYPELGSARAITCLDYVRHGSCSNTRLSRDQRADERAVEI
jgi:hypothetical protein